MDPVAALHDAARRYCLERHAELHARYGVLTEAQVFVPRFDHGWDYTAAARDLFPRTNVIEAILCEVEAFVPADLGGLDDARALLAACGDATAGMPRHDHPVEAAAVADERRRFVAAIAGFDAAAEPPDPLPYRRTLGAAEHAALHRALRARWGAWYGGCRDAASSATATQPTLTVHVDAMADPASYRQLRRVLAEHGVARVLELREHGDGHELALELASFAYNGAEGFWTVASLDWMVYASHEDSISFGGAWLVDGIRAALPGLDRFPAP